MINILISFVIYFRISRISWLSARCKQSILLLRHLPTCGFEMVSSFRTLWVLSRVFYHDRLLPYCDRVLSLCQVSYSGVRLFSEFTEHEETRAIYLTSFCQYIVVLYRSSDCSNRITRSSWLSSLCICIIYISITLLLYIHLQHLACISNAKFSHPAGL